MSDQFTFDQLNLWNWNQSVSLKSFKNPNFTMSEVSQSRQDNLSTLEEEQDQGWNLAQFNKKAEKKLKNRANVKNFRERQKIQQQRILQKLKLLQHQNYCLRKQKYCRQCKRPYGGLIQMSETTQLKQRHSGQQSDKQFLNTDGKEYLEFEKPIFYTKNKPQTNNRNGKIWIAFGILMMVIGVHIYGFRGKEGYQDISISKIQSKKIIDIYEGKSTHMGDYLDVKVKYKSKTDPKQTQKQQDIFREIRIFHEQQKYEKGKKYSSFARQTLSKLQMIDQQNQKVLDSQQFQLQHQEQVKFHKDLLYAMQAEIDEVGQYI